MSWEETLRAMQPTLTSLRLRFGREVVVVPEGTVPVFLTRDELIWWSERFKFSSAWYEAQLSAKADSALKETGER